jgi:integrase
LRQLPEVSEEILRLGLSEAPIEGGMSAICIQDDCGQKPKRLPMLEAEEGETLLTLLNRIVLKVNWRSLRTSCATWMVHAGADPKSVQGQMRHSRISTTMDIYAQFVPEGQKQAQKQLRAYVERAVPAVPIVFQ